MGGSVMLWNVVNVFESSKQLCLIICSYDKRKKHLTAKEKTEIAGDNRFNIERLICINRCRR